MNVVCTMTVDKHDTFLAYAFSQGIFRKNLLIALIVGVVLTLANQFDVLFGQPWTPRLGFKIAFNFVIPFVVSSAAAWLNRKTP